MDYSKTLWKDHIKDQNGNVIQQGTPVSAQHLNNIENGLATAVEEINNNAGMIRETIPSGFTTLSDLDYSYMATNPNQIKLSSDSIAFVNGYKITIPAGTIIQLDAPPTYDPIAKTGVASRDDLVFLEVWKTPVTDTGGEKINWRIRVADGVDFSKLTEGLGTIGSPKLNEVDIAYGLGGSNLSNSDIASNSDNNYRYAHQFFKEIPDAWKGIEPLINDVGLYRAGYSAYQIENTADGYSYAIPMFKVHRRNSGEYSVNNGNGAILYNTIDIAKDNLSVQTGQIVQKTVSRNYDKLSVGDYIMAYAETLYKAKIISLDGSNKVTLLNLGGAFDNWAFAPVYDSIPDLLFADIVDDKDILDLRHQVSLTGFNYQELLEENFDKLLRGELQTKERTKMLKTYHGIPKTPIDANTVFYASLDETIVAEVGGNPVVGNSSNVSYKPSVTGLGAKFTGKVQYSIPKEDIYTIDTIIDDNVSSVGENPIVLMDKSNNTIIANVYINPTNSIIAIGTNVFSSTSTASNLVRDCAIYLHSCTLKKYNHIRLVLNYTTKIVKLYINGILVGSASMINPYMPSDNLAIAFSTDENNIFYPSTLTYSDVSVSNIDRGSVFATLSQDFIDGYALIDKAFNSQRNVFSDALTTETKQELIQPDITKNKPYIHLGDATDWIKDDSTKWNAGDRIKLDTLTGEIITGVIDTDTAICKVVELININGGNYKYKVDNVSKLSINDKLILWNDPSGGYSIVTNIDTTTNIITCDAYEATGTAYTNLVGTKVGDLFFETTPSSSSPLVKFNPSGMAQSGGANTVTLSSSFSDVDDAYNGLAISIDSGTGAGQVKTITDYVGSTRVATVDSNWTTPPDTTSDITVHSVNVGGTWSGLGTTEAIYTLPATLPDTMTHQYLSLTYAITEVSGQGGIPEVLTQTLAGEYKGDKLNPNPSYHILDDFAGKVSKSIVENPNIAKRTAGGDNKTKLLNPSQFVNELGENDEGIAVIEKLDNSTSSVDTNINGAVSQHLFGFNIIEIVERKYGTIQGDTTKDKVDWLKNNLARIVCNWWGYGSCPSGNKAHLKLFRNAENDYYDEGANCTHTLNTISRLYFTFGTEALYTAISNAGFVYFLAYTDASDGTTPSTIYTDYINIEVTLNTPTGYDVLAPENIRRDAGKSNILLVRKETKEIQLMFGSGSNLDGIVTYGDYVPPQALNQDIGDNYGKLNSRFTKMFLTTIGTGSYTGDIPHAHYLLQNALGYDTHNLKEYQLDGSSILPDKYFTDDKIIPINLLRRNSLFLDIDIGIKGTYSSAYKNTVMPMAFTLNSLLGTDINVMSLRAYFALSSVNNEVILWFIALQNSSQGFRGVLEIKNKPLIKGGN